MFDVGGAGVTFEGAIYSDNGSGYPGDLLAYTPPTVTTANGFNYALLNQTAVIPAAQTGWVAVHTDTILYNNGYPGAVGSVYNLANDNFGNLPAVCTTANYTRGYYLMSFYAVCIP
jgi:hypothetical protein